MRIACPACQATYEVPDALIGAGRMLRCAKCGHDWLVTGEAALPDAAPDAARPPEPTPAAASAPAPVVRPPAPEPPASDLPPPTPAQRRPPQLIDPPLPDPWNLPPSRRAVVAIWAAWIGSALLLGGLGAAAWVYRDPIMEAWPPAARVYLMLGAERNG